METLLRTFNSIKNFSVRDAEKTHPKFDNISKLTLEIDKDSVVLTGPFRPLGRPGKDLNRLKSLSEKNIDFIRLFAEWLDGQSAKQARIEIWMKNGDKPILVRCERIEINCVKAATSS